MPLTGCEMRVTLLPRSAARRALQAALAWRTSQRQALFLATHPLGGVGSILTELAASEAASEIAGLPTRRDGLLDCLQHNRIKGERRQVLIARVQRQREPEQRELFYNTAYNTEHKGEQH